MLKKLGTITTVMACFVAGIATLVAGYWLGIIASLIMGVISIVAIVFGVVCIIVYTIIEAVTLDEKSEDPDDSDRDR